MKHTLKNPIIPGFYPDPSICRVGNDFYLVCSSFELHPGIPLFHSRDLAHWEQLCYVMNRENGFHAEKNCYNGGVMAPTIRYHNGTFYIINANFSDRGNFITTATNPAGPWSEPHWLEDVPGIDASIFFDDDGQCYIMGTANIWPDGKGGMRQGIWAAPYDIQHFKLAGEPVALWGGALAGAASPESPHIYHIGDYYYLLIAEGGTEQFHSATIARSKHPLGPYEGNPSNPILTHRHMGYTAPIQNVGHADLIDLPDGSWYAVFLGSRLIDGVSKNLGRETFICPVKWERDWPLFTPDTGKVEAEYDAPACLTWTEFAPEPVRDDFDSDKLALSWTLWGTPYEKVYDIADSRLTLRCLSQSLAEPLRGMGFHDAKSEDHYVSFVAKRRLQPDTTVTCQMSFVPHAQESAGLAIVQAMNHQYHLQVVQQDGQRKVQLVRYHAAFDLQPYFPGFTSETMREVLAEADWNSDSILLQLELHGNDYTFRFGAEENAMTELAKASGFAINPEKVGCMTGEVIGLFATGNGTESDNTASFDWAEYQ